GVQPGRTGREADRVVEPPERDAPPVDREREILADAGRDRVRVAAPAELLHLVALLEGRDLGEIEDVGEVDAVARDLDAREVVRREVPERVRRRGGGHRECSDGGRRGEEFFHRYLLATGLQIGEKCGFSASARSNHAWAACGWPAQRSAMARWKN